MKDRRLCTQASWHAWVFTSVASCLLWVLLVHLQPPQLAASAHNNTRHISGDWLFQHRFDRCDVMTCFENMNSLEGCRVLMLGMLGSLATALLCNVLVECSHCDCSEWVASIHWSIFCHLLSCTQGCARLGGVEPLPAVTWPSTLRFTPTHSLELLINITCTSLNEWHFDIVWTIPVTAFFSQCCGTFELLGLVNNGGQNHCISKSNLRVPDTFRRSCFCRKLQKSAAPLHKVHLKVGQPWLSHALAVYPDLSKCLKEEM